MISRINSLSLLDQLVIAVSLLAVSLLLIDPFLYQQAHALQPDIEKFFRTGC